MTDTQHTPGPWAFNTGPYSAVVYAVDIGTVANVTEDLIAWRANARLIAAAPELLALLAEAVARVEDLINGYESAVEDLAAWSDDARDAIAKATGGQS